MLTTFLGSHRCFWCYQLHLRSRIRCSCKISSGSFRFIVRIKCRDAFGDGVLNSFPNSWSSRGDRRSRAYLCLWHNLDYLSTERSKEIVFLRTLLRLGWLSAKRSDNIVALLFLLKLDCLSAK